MQEPTITAVKAEAKNHVVKLSTISCIVPSRVSVVPSLPQLSERWVNLASMAPVARHGNAAAMPLAGRREACLWGALSSIDTLVRSATTAAAIWTMKRPLGRRLLETLSEHEIISETTELTPGILDATAMPVGLNHSISRAPRVLTPKKYGVILPHLRMV
jgi:hypothetical protein